MNVRPTTIVFISILLLSASAMLPAEQAAAPATPPALTSAAELQAAIQTAPTPTLIYFYNGLGSREAAAEQLIAKLESEAVLSGVRLARLNVSLVENRNLAMDRGVMRVPGFVAINASAEPMGTAIGRDIDEGRLRQLIASARTPAALNVAPQQVAEASTSAPASVAPAAGAPQPAPNVATIVGVGRYGDGKADYDGRPLYIIGTTSNDIGREVVFDGLTPGDGSRWFTARFDAEATRQRDLQRSSVNSPDALTSGAMIHKPQAAHAAVSQDPFGSTNSN